MTGILRVFLQPEHILFHFPLLLSFLPVENFSNPFSPLEKAQGSMTRKRKKEKTVI